MMLRSPYYCNIIWRCHDEEVEVIEQEAKILAKIICTPGVKTFIADIKKQMFAIIKDIDSDA